MKLLVTGGAGYIGSTLVPFFCLKDMMWLSSIVFSFGDEYLKFLSNEYNLQLVRETLDHSVVAYSKASMQ